MRFIRSWPRAIVHIDGDAFFASCEQAMHPEWKGRPVVTGKERGIVAAASYEAKAKGVSRGTPLWEVKKLCPDAIIVPSDYESYSLFSKRMFVIMRRYTSTVEEYSIDEAFADITGLRGPLKGSYIDIALRMKQEIERELGITVSVGVSLSKVLAKIGSKWKKPAGLTVISGRHIDDFLRGLDVEKLWGIGAQTAAYCRQLGIKDSFDFATRNSAWITERFAKPYQEIWAELNGESVYPVVTVDKSSYASIGKTRTFTPPSADRTFVYAQLLKNLENACIKARRHKLAARSVAVFLKKQDFGYDGTEVRLTRATAFPMEFEESIRKAFDGLFRQRTAYRATGVTLLGLEPAGATQLGLFEKPLALEKMKRLYGAVDALAEKFGKHAVRLAGSEAAHRGAQHEKSRGATPLRKLMRLKGETSRQHLTIPVLAWKLS